MKRIKILFIITHLELGGAQRHLLYLLRGLDKDKYSLYVCAGDKGYLRDEFLKISGASLNLMPSLTREINPFLDLITFFRLFFFIKKNKFDIVHTHSPKASFLGRWAAFLGGVKDIVYTVHGWPFHEFMNPLSFGFYLFLEKITARVTKKIIVVSQHDLDKALLRKVAAELKFSLIHCGVDIEPLKRVFDKRNNGCVERDLIITISSLKAQKGLAFFLRMAGLLRDHSDSLKFLIAGGGRDRKRIVRQLSDLGLEKKVILTGWVDDIYSLLSKSAVLVLSSLWEGLPLSVIEGAVCGVPMVVTDTKGLNDIISEGNNAIIVRPGDAEALSRAVVSVLDNYDDWTKQIKGKRQTLRLYDWSKEKMIESIEGLYSRL